ncbi:MAG: hypothetical protein U0271_33255 [Polyangiaceae bacterium]
MAKSKTAKSKASKKDKPDAVAGPSTSAELQQLAAIRERFPALSKEVADALYAQHDSESCRAKGKDTKSDATFRGAMAWARTLGENATELPISSVKVRWFLDCLTLLGTLLDKASPVDANPAYQAAFDACEREGKKLIARTERRLRDAAGSDAAWCAELAALPSPPDFRHPLVARLEDLEAALRRWLTDPARAQLLTITDLTEASADALGAIRARANELLATRPAQGQFERDSPQLNIAEGRLYFIMRPLWDDLADARQDGETVLQLPVTPALMRGLDMAARKRSKTPKPA